MDSNIPSTAILLSTCKSYQKYVEITCNIIERYWKYHPEIFIVGGSGVSGYRQISFNCSENDWIGMAYEAVSWLGRSGFEYMYLILDDHPPVGHCNLKFLNQTMPCLAKNLNATHFMLSGWDQFQPKKGEYILKDGQKLLKNDKSFKWKFDLHPGFWNISHLKNVLNLIIDISPRVYSAREFEGAAANFKLNIPQHYLENTYKLEGDRNAEGRRWYQNPIKRKYLLFAIYLMRTIFLKLPSRWCRVFDAKIEIYTQYINGPYPMYWSGFVKKGSLNTNLIKFIQITKNRIFQSSLNSIQ